MIEWLHRRSTRGLDGLTNPSLPPPNPSFFLSQVIVKPGQGSSGTCAPTTAPNATVCDEPIVVSGVNGATYFGCTFAGFFDANSGQFPCGPIYQTPGLLVQSALECLEYTYVHVIKTTGGMLLFVLFADYSYRPFHHFVCLLKQTAAAPTNRLASPLMRRLSRPLLAIGA